MSSQDKFISASRRFLSMLLGCICVLTAIAPAKAETPITDPPWRYSLEQPADNWMAVDFDDSQWKEGLGGFGTRETPGSRVGTEWSAREIWIRRQIEVQAIPAQPALYIHHDDEAEVYLNGRLIATFQKWTSDYQIVPLDAAAATAIRQGVNTLAVHCHQDAGGQFIDVHLIAADNEPMLPFRSRSAIPIRSELITQWGEQVTAENVWREYPRPGLQRDNWVNLNGHWDYAVTKETERSIPEKWEGKILVPFALESKLSGVQRLLDPDEALWYHTSFVYQAQANSRTLLNFEAVDYECQVWVNGKEVGSHIGGNNPFQFDITAVLNNGSNELVVRVEDDQQGWQLNGKQSLNPRGIWYTQLSGIWQTVWLEQVPTHYIAELDVATVAKTGEIQVVPTLVGSSPAKAVRLTVMDGEQSVAVIHQPLQSADSNSNAIVARIANAKLWSPNSPHLYSLRIELVGAGGESIDSVQSYAGIRTVGKSLDPAGHWRFTLNGNEVFHFGPLDQGWWPDGLLTPPSDEAMQYDIQFLKAAGFNMIRKHIKVEPRRYYYHCDVMGMMVWQDQVSGGKNPPWTRLAKEPVDRVWSDRHHAQFMREFEEMVDSLEFHPCIVVWTPFNEAWGQHRTLDVGKWILERDPTRLVNIASGGNFWPIGDIVDEHNYPHPRFPFDAERYGDYIKVVGEFGGHGLPVEGHLWDTKRENWGYGGLPKNAAEYRERYVESIRILAELKKQGIAAGVYTQTTDVEEEINGLMTYDRKVQKLSTEDLKQIHSVLEIDP